VSARLEWAATRAVAAASGRPLIHVVATAAWTYDTAIEETVKVAPLALAAWLWPKVHRQLGWTDHPLI